MKSQLIYNRGGLDVSIVPLFLFFFSTEKRDETIHEMPSTLAQHSALSFLFSSYYEKISFADARRPVARQHLGRHGVRQGSLSPPSYS
jgi:hypothetical protein